MITPSDSALKLIGMMSVKELIEILSRKTDVEDGDMITLAPSNELREIIIFQLARLGVEREEINTRLNNLKKGTPTP